MSTKDGVLFLVLKEPWFSMHKSGEKLEEYRDIKPHYIRQFIKDESLKKDLIRDYERGFDDGEIEALKNEAVYHKFDTAHYAKGMPKKGTQPEKHIFFNNPKIKAGYGKPEWGAKTGKLYFVITRKK